MIHGDGLSAKVNLDPKGVVHPAPRLFPWPAVDDLGKPSTAFNCVGMHWLRSEFGRLADWLVSPQAVNRQAATGPHRIKS